MKVIKQINIVQVELSQDEVNAIAQLMGKITESTMKAVGMDDKNFEIISSSYEAFHEIRTDID